jgi:cytochrome c oxidase cbb3-type subunit 3/ubiquinol-cytochrome c reductase cytochrome c subunit
MNVRRLNAAILFAAMAIGAAGCHDAPGKPKDGSEASRPEQVMDFASLYGQNCAACHGVQGRNGTAISLANPIYLATAGEANIRRITAAGVTGTMMPPFAKSAGGMLTDEQIAALTHGMISSWGQPTALNGQNPPQYAGAAPGDVARGASAFSNYCARCHGADGSGINTKDARTGSLVDASYLSLISDQGLRSYIVAGQPEQGMPDWRSDMAGSGAHAMSEQEIADVVAWIVSHRSATPGQEYQR